MPAAAGYLDCMLNLLRTRRSIRVFQPKPLEPHLLAEFREAALRAPTARNAKSPHFVFVTDPEVLEALSRCKPTGAAFLAQAALGVVVCGDESRTDCWVEDASIAATHLQLLAHARGLGSTWCHVRGRKHDDQTSSEAYVQQALGIPGQQRVVCIVGIGVPAEQKDPWPEDKLEEGRVRG